MEQSEQINELAAEFAEAFAKCQAEYPHLPRSKEVAVRTKAGGTYKFSYAPLEEILRLYRPVLNKHSFTLVQGLAERDCGWSVETVLSYKNGYSLRSQVPVFHVEQGPQAFGSGVTYARRAGVTLILCLAADDDDDANTAEGNEATVRGDRSGRPDTSGVDQELVKSYKASLTKALQNADKETILADHNALKTQEALYSAVWDSLSSKQRTDLRSIIAEANRT